MSESGVPTESVDSEDKSMSLYIFSGQGAGAPRSPTDPGSEANDTSTSSEGNTEPDKTGRPAPKTHARSASHGTVLSSPKDTNVTLRETAPDVRAMRATTAFSRPSALKKPGHQRAFSQGMVSEVPRNVSGHSRVGSKTDFILPPGHREEPRQPAAKAPSFRGHSRQASRSESIYTIRRSTTVPWWRRMWMRCFGVVTEEPRMRTIIPNHLIPQKTPPKKHPDGVKDNRVRTTKYTILTFLPRNLMEQFHRVANLYFIFIVLLNWVPAINAFGKEIAMVPVIFVLGVTALKDFFEDRRRFANDRRINNSTCRVYISDGDRYKRVAWKDIKVGDLVHLSNNELVPADVLLLRSSDPQGFAYLDTCNLDGETNLKQRQVIRGFLDLQNNFQPSKFRSVLEVDRPSTKIYRFHGAVIHPSGVRVPVSTENLLLRECLLKNTDFVEGIVVYAGHETKAMLNNGGPRYKRSRLEKQMNVDVIWCVIILVILCVVGATGCRLWLSVYASSAGYIAGSIPFLYGIQDPGYESMLAFWMFIVIFQIMIPLSLYVTIEMTKIGQVYHIGHDPALNDPESGRKAECRALNITEELGQIQYVFSDKTGTLTENKMLFRRCVVGDQDYEHLGEGEKLVPCSRLKEDLLIGSYRHRLQEFLISLAICNTVVVNAHPHRDIMSASGVVEKITKMERFIKKHSPLGFYNNRIQDESPSVEAGTQSRTENGDPIFEAESPDELALVKAAKIYNVSLIKRTPKSAIVLIPNKQTLTFEVLKVLPFDANRKCMSVIVRHPISGKIILYSKGADTTIMPSLSVDAEDELPTSRAKIRQSLQTYARQGLRTLVMAKRTLDVQEYETWRKKLEEAEAVTDNRERRIQDSYASLEKHLTLLGATGVEDKLQVGVPEAMSALVSAGIVIWVLTGDKPETAVNIAYASGLFSPSMQLLDLQAKSKSVAETLIHNHLEAIQRENILNSSNHEQPEYNHVVTSNSHDLLIDFGPTASRNHDQPNDRDDLYKKQRALIVDGKTLTFILDPKSGLTAPFLELTRICCSVLACRATPLQKAYIVRVVKEKLKMRTLAIGDGANDVSMIRTADVGVGVAGREGTQAVMASDFVIGKFPMLVPLLLHHGHWCYDRLSKMILYFFYKNATFVFLTFLYQFYCGFSGAVMFDQIYLMLYNLFFTSLPPLALGIYDRIAPASILLETPKLYERGRLALAYQPHYFWVTIADALYQSVVIFLVTTAAYYDSDVDIWEFGTTIMSACIIVMLAHALIEAKSWTIIHAAAILASLGGFFGFCLFYNAVCVNCMGLLGSYWVIEKAFTRHTYWLILVLSSVLALMPRVLYKTLKTTFAPDMIYLATMERKNKMHRLSNQRLTETNETELVANWSRSTQHATIRPGDYATKSSNLTTIVS